MGTQGPFRGHVRWDLSLESSHGMHNARARVRSETPPAESPLKMSGLLIARYDPDDVPLAEVRLHAMVMPRVSRNSEPTVTPRVLEVAHVTAMECSSGAPVASEVCCVE